MSGGWRLIADGLAFPEGPAFADDGSLWAVELSGGAITQVTTGGLRRVAVGGAPNGLAFWNSEAWFCDADGLDVRLFGDIDEARALKNIAPGALDRPNDLAFDTLGTMVFTCPGNSRVDPTGTVWARSVEGIKPIAADLFFPNGLAFTPEGDQLIVAETYRQRLWIGDWIAGAAVWRNAKPWVQLSGPIGPDGMAFSDDGTLFVAVFGQGHLSVIKEDKEVERIPTPGLRPTNVAIDPVGLLGLIVTEAEHGRIWSKPIAGLRPALFTKRCPKAARSFLNPC